MFLAKSTPLPCFLEFCLDLVWWTAMTFSSTTGIALLHFPFVYLNLLWMEGVLGYDLAWTNSVI
jgi:hypothetical protein